MIKNLNKNQKSVNINTSLKETNILSLFNKKRNMIANKPLKNLDENRGIVRHFTPAAQEWYNSVYTYNKYYIKTLPTADINLMKLLKSYFNQKKNSKRKKYTKKESILLFTKKDNKKAILLTIKKRLNEYFQLSSVKKAKNKKISRLFLKNSKIKSKFLSLSIKKYKYDTSLEKYIDIKDKSLEKVDNFIESDIDDKSMLFFRKKRFKKKSRFARRWKIRKINKLKAQPAAKKRIKKKPKILYTKKIFVGKGNIKHTNDKVVITFFLYDAKAMYLSSKYNVEKKRLFYPNIRFKRWIKKNRLNNNKIIKNKRRFNIYESLTGRLLVLLYKRHIRVLTKKYNKEMKKINRVINVENYIILNNKEKLNLLNVINQSINSFYYPSYNDYKKLAYKAFMRKLKVYSKLLAFNKQKYKYSFLYKFIPLVENLYRKRVIFNIVNLKKLHNSSDIYTQIITLKLRNRNNKLYRVLKTFLEKINLRLVRRNIRETDFNLSNVRANQTKNNLISSMVERMYYNRFYRLAYYKKLLAVNEKKNLMFERNFQDPLNRLILEYFNTTDIAEWFRNKKKLIVKKGWLSRINLRKERKALKVAYDVFTINYVLGRLKQNKLRGVRVEAKGRLTRRRTASRSVFKMKYKGGLKNPISSFKGLSAIMLRGDQKSNLEYTSVNSNGRNGAFGVKGWIASRTRKVKTT